MLNVKTIRITNLFALSGIPAPVTLIGMDAACDPVMIKTDASPQPIPMQKLIPIEITPRRLELLGFERTGDKDHYRLEDSLIMAAADHYTLYVGNCIINNIYWIHQLQNVFTDLITDKELSTELLIAEPMAVGPSSGYFELHPMHMDD